jgi:hypothetical protein
MDALSVEISASAGELIKVDTHVVGAIDRYVPFVGDKLLFNYFGRMIHIDEWLLRSIEAVPWGYKRASALSKIFMEAIEDQLANLERPFRHLPAAVQNFRQLERRLSEIQALACLPPSAAKITPDWWKSLKREKGKEWVSPGGCLPLGLLVVSCRKSVAYLHRVEDVVKNTIHDLGDLEDRSILPLDAASTTGIEEMMIEMIRESLSDLEAYKTIARN